MKTFQRVMASTLGSAAAAAMILAAGATSAADYPCRSVEWIVGWGSGGGSDRFARSIAPGVAEQLGVKEEEVTNAASFVDDLGADSLDTVELVMALEEEFETEIPDEEAEKITTVQQAIDFIAARAGGS